MKSTCNIVQLAAVVISRPPVLAISCSIRWLGCGIHQKVAISVNLLRSELHGDTGDI